MSCSMRNNTNDVLFLMKLYQTSQLPSDSKLFHMVSKQNICSFLKSPKTTLSWVPLKSPRYELTKGNISSTPCMCRDALCDQSCSTAGWNCYLPVYLQTLERHEGNYFPLTPHISHVIRMAHSNLQC